MKIYFLPPPPSKPAGDMALLLNKIRHEDIDLIFFEMCYKACWLWPAPFSKIIYKFFLTNSGTITKIERNAEDSQAWSPENTTYAQQ